MWSIAEHGPTPALVASLRPLLLKYGVAAYFSGHDHNLQHLAEARSSAALPRAPAGGEPTMDYVLTGASHGIDLSVEHENSVPGARGRRWRDAAADVAVGTLHAVPHPSLTTRPATATPRLRLCSGRQQVPLAASLHLGAAEWLRGRRLHRLQPQG